ncbi:MAG TPA: GDSL-type esterase/lipase family protein [Candidatus Limnocylindria bacterium]|nr:GDSL-type esterase/lipase family protein [Candidatus Limnocylindria bacterium]
MWKGELAVLLVICAAFAIACSAAPAAQPSPTRGGAASPSSAPASATSSTGIKYVAIGASDTVGVGASDPANGSWPALVAARLPAGSPPYTNLGVAGSLTLQAVSQQLPGAIAQKPSLISVWLAVNDLNATIEPASFAESLAEIVDGLVQRTGATIFVGNVPDLRTVPVYAGADKARLFAGIQAYNDAIASIAAKNPTRVKVVDLFTGSAALVSTGTVSQDGFHPSDEGYRLIAERFETAMRASGVPLRG